VADTSPSGPTARFAELVGGPGEPALDEGALLIAAHARPDLDVRAEVGRLDDLARGCPGTTLDDLRTYLFEELGFRGNTDEYDDPANSYLDVVLDRRVGIPITLGVLTVEVGRRVGVRLGAVGMPGHVLVRSLDEPGLFVDPFGGGAALGAPECAEVFHRVMGPGAEFDPAFLDVSDHRTILWRMLTNLRSAFAARSDLGSLRWSAELQLAFPDVSAQDRHRLAALLGTVGGLRRAAVELEAVADALPDDAADSARRQARVLRARLN
jgi:regulator of sirC expression with transglutaminase-like and TPR domain